MKTGPCNASIGFADARRGTKDCWAVDAETGNEIPGTRYTFECELACTETSLVIVCEERCQDIGPCSESCGADGIMKGTKGCKETETDTGEEIRGSRHTVDCIKPCIIPCPSPATIPCNVYISYLSLI